MPLRSRQSLLVGIAAFVGLGAGCQTGGFRTDGAASGPGPATQTVLAFVHRFTPAEAAPAPPAPAVNMVEGRVIASSSPLAAPPRPTAPVVGNGGVASVWQPVQRVNAESPAPAVSPSGVTPASITVADPSGGAVRASIEAPVVRPLLIAANTAPNEPTPMPPSTPMPPATPAPPAQAPMLPLPHLEPQPVAVIAPPVLAHPAPPREFAKQPLPPYVVEPPDILLIQATTDVTLPNRPIDGQHLVRPDGTISLGVYGSVYVAGATLEEVRDAVAAQIHLSVTKLPGTPPERTLDEIKKGVVADVLAYNSKVYYVITDGAGYGEQVYPIPVTGNETVLDAMAKINGLPPAASKKRIWVARATPHCDHPDILPVDWCGITQRGCADTNYQIFPGDRVYVASDKWLITDSYLAKRLNPINRLLGTILLGSSTVNSIKGTPGIGG